jgi:hypothetical protein
VERKIGIKGGRTRAIAILTVAMYTAVGAAGSWWVFHPTLASHFNQLQTDPGDPLLTNYLLEHELRALTRPGHAGTFWSPPFYYPARNALTYTENMMGILPIYALLRLGWDPTTSHQLLAILLCLLDYAAMLLVLRQLGVLPALAAWGAFFFAFGTPRLWQLGHIQLLPVFYAPLSLLMIERLVTAPSRSRVAILLLLVYLQLLSGIYLGWFLLLTLGILLPLRLAWDRDGRGRLADFCRRSWPSLALSLACWAAASYLTFRPYLAASLEFGARPWRDVLLFLPRIRSWFTAPPGGWYEPILPGFSPDVFGVSEHFLFPGMVLLALGLVSAGYTLRLSRPERRRQALLVACWLLAAVLFALSLVLPRVALDHLRLVRFYPGISLWWFVFNYVPGAGAIRAVGRISIFIYLVAVVAVCYGADAAIRRSRLRTAARGGLLAALLIAGVAEQYIAGLPNFPKQSFLGQVAEVRSRIPSGCRVLYVTQGSHQPYPTWQLVAMWAGLEANLPVVNGYSGNTPPHYPGVISTMTAAELRAWSGDDPCVVSGE